MRFKGKRRVGRPQLLEDDLDRALRALGAGPDTVPLAVLRVWPKVVGPLAARSTQPVLLVRGKLVVHVASEVWMTEIIADSEPLLTRLEKALGRLVVRTLHVRVASLLPTPAAKPRRPERRPAEVPADVERMLGSIDDPELKESLRRAVGWSLGRPVR